MTTSPKKPERADLTDGLNIPRIVTGLWQVADMERGGEELAIDAAAAELGHYADAGFDAFDMADHYGSAELIAGRFLEQASSPAHVFTKWVPEPGEMTAAVVRAGVQERLERLGVDSIDLLQFHWWQFEHPGYLDAMIELDRLRQDGLITHLGLTNFDTNHLRVLVRHGIKVISNQVSFSLIDQRAAGDLSQFCLDNGIRLMTYGSLCGGLLSKRWLGHPEPSDNDITDWSKMKYLRFIAAAGGWQVLQDILAALDDVAEKHGVSISNVASRWVLEHPAVAAIIVGARLGERDHRADNLAVFDFALDEADLDRIKAASEKLCALPGDCGDEYRRPPFLTASGDLSHHLDTFDKFYTATPVPQRAQRQRVDSGSIWEVICGFSRAVREGNRILVSGTTATHSDGTDVCPGDAAGQTTYILDKIAASISALGGAPGDVVRTRIYVAREADWEDVSRVHGCYFGEVRPANTLIVVAGLIGGYLVEIEAEAVVDDG
ncbi:MAG: aldo/keto reductase [Rhizobiales bacterium]|nr:aldo/keto reductase [Hyphomicrobiales bacterium]